MTFDATILRYGATRWLNTGETLVGPSPLSLQAEYLSFLTVLVALAIARVDACRVENRNTGGDDEQHI